MSAAFRSGASSPVTKDTVYADLGLSFVPHPVTRKPAVLKNNAAIARAVRNLILTNHFERPYQPLLGGNVRGRLFENMDRLTEVDVRKDIETAIRNYEPRAVLLSTEVEARDDNNELRVKITFRAVNQRDPVEIDVLLSRVR